MRILETTYDCSSARFDRKFTTANIHTPEKPLPDINSNEMMYAAIRLEWTPYPDIVKDFPQAITGSEDILGDIELSLPTENTCSPAVTIEIAELVSRKIVSKVLDLPSI